MKPLTSKNSSHPFSLLALLLMMLLAFSAGCGPNSGANRANPIAGLDQSELTGADITFTRKDSRGRDEEVRVPFTISGAPDVFNNLRNEMGPRSDKTWARSLKTVTIENDGPNFNMSVDFDPALKIPNNRLEFEAPATHPVPNQPLIVHAKSNAAQTQPYDYSAKVLCHGDCQVFEVKIEQNPKAADVTNPQREKTVAPQTTTASGPNTTMTPEPSANTNTKPEKAPVVGATNPAQTGSKTVATSSTPPNPKTVANKQIGFVYRKAVPKIDLRTDPAFENSKVNQDLKKSITGTKAEYVSVSVVDGPSYAVITTPNNFRLQTNVVDTQAGRFGVSQASFQDSKNVRVELVGNDRSGSLLLEVLDTTTKSKSLLVIENEPTPVFRPQQEAHPPAQTSPPSTINDTAPVATPTHPVEKKNVEPQLTPQNVTPARPEVAAPKIQAAEPQTKIELFGDHRESAQIELISQSFDKYNDHPDVKQMINAWLGKEPDPYRCSGSVSPSPHKLRAFLSHAPPVSRYLSQVLNAMDVPTSAAYLLLFESQYLLDPSYNSLEISPAPDTALGPWQMNNPTAADFKKMSGISFNLFTKRREVNKQDDRTYLLNATYLASQKIKYDLDLFKRDHVNGIMAYHAGSGGANEVLRDTVRRIKNSYGLVTFKEVLRFRQQTGENCKYIKYALSFLAVRAIGQNLSDYSQYGLDRIPVTTSTKYQERLVNPKSPLPQISL